LRYKKSWKGTSYEIININLGNIWSEGEEPWWKGGRQKKKDYPTEKIIITVGKVFGAEGEIFVMLKEILLQKEIGTGATRSWLEKSTRESF